MLHASFHRVSVSIVETREDSLESQVQLASKAGRQSQDLFIRAHCYKFAITDCHRFGTGLHFIYCPDVSVVEDDLWFLSAQERQSEHSANALEKISTR